MNFKEKEHYVTRNGLVVYVLTITGVIFGRMFHRDGSVSHDSWFKTGKPIVREDEFELINKDKQEDGKN